MAKKRKKARAKNRLKNMRRKTLGRNLRQQWRNKNHGPVIVKRDGVLVENPRMPDQELRRRVFDADRGICAYCGLRLEWPHFNIEHVVPWPDGLTKFENLVSACRGCNYRKLGQYVVSNTRIRTPAETVRLRLRKRLQNLNINPDTFPGYTAEGKWFTEATQRQWAE